MLFVLARTIEPAIVRNVHEKVNRRAVAVLPAILSRQERVAVLVANEHAEMIRFLLGGELQAGQLLALADAVVEVVGGESLKKRQPVRERHILAERDAVNLVITAADVAVGIDQEGG